MKAQSKGGVLIYYKTARVIVATWCEYVDAAAAAAASATAAAAAAAADDDDYDDYDDADACMLVGLANICAIKTRASVWS